MKNICAKFYEGLSINEGIMERNMFLWLIDGRRDRQTDWLKNREETKNPFWLKKPYNNI